jgi:hypothetical protein
MFTILYLPTFPGLSLKAGVNIKSETPNLMTPNVQKRQLFRLVCQGYNSDTARPSPKTTPGVGTGPNTSQILVHFGWELGMNRPLAAAPELRNRESQGSLAFLSPSISIPYTQTQKSLQHFHPDLKIQMFIRVDSI